MRKEEDPSGRKIQVPYVPSLERIPFLTPIKADYGSPDFPPTEARNPLYRALPREQKGSDIRTRYEKLNEGYDPEIRGKSDYIRRERITLEVTPCIFPVGRYRELHRHLITVMRGRYRGLKPMHAAFMDETVANQSGGGPVGTGALIGNVGLGKSEALKRELCSLPQVIGHTSFDGYPVGFNQLAWMYVPCPPKASADGLLRFIAVVLDRILKSDVLGDVRREKNLSARTRIVANALSAALVGVVCIDEIQNGTIGTIHERDLFENTLQELINTTATRFMFIGTPNVDRIRSEALKRRFEGESGMLTWRPFALDDEWLQFIRELWTRQYTAVETPLTDALIEETHHLTGGIPDCAIKLWVKTQLGLIGEKDELITSKQLRKVLENSLPRYAKMLRVRENVRKGITKLRISPGNVAMGKENAPTADSGGGI